MLSIFLAYYEEDKAISDLFINEQIRDKEVRVIGEDGEQLGIMPSREALRLAEEAGLDLVKIAPPIRDHILLYTISESLKIITPLPPYVNAFFTRFHRTVISLMKWSINRAKPPGWRFQEAQDRMSVASGSSG